MTVGKIVPPPARFCQLNCRIGLAVRRDPAKAKWRRMISRRCLSPDAESGSTPPKFEDLLARLEQIVADMENAELPLEKLLASYEEGMRLVKACGDRLADAEQKVEILSRSLTDSAKGAASATPAAEPAADKDDIRLF
jgi:exodeoxyribonuclease VII small subunit